MHGLYSLVWSNPPENPNFVYDVLPKYHSFRKLDPYFEKQFSVSNALGAT